MRKSQADKVVTNTNRPGFLEQCTFTMREAIRQATEWQNKLGERNSSEPLWFYGSDAIQRSVQNDFVKRPLIFLNKKAEKSVLFLDKIALLGMIKLHSATIRPGPCHRDLSQMPEETDDFFWVPNFQTSPKGRGDCLIFLSHMFGFPICEVLVRIWRCLTMGSKSDSWWWICLLLGTKIVYSPKNYEPVAY